MTNSTSFHVEQIKSGFAVCSDDGSIHSVLATREDAEAAVKRITARESARQMMSTSY